MTTTSPTVTTTDRVRQVTVLIGAALAIVGAAWGSGAFGGTPIEEAAGGALAADATLLAPATGAFGIWSVIYLGLAAFAVVQALPSRAADPRMRAVAWPILASMILNAVWIGTVQAGLLWLSVIVIAVLVATLARVAVVLIARRPERIAERPGWQVIPAVAEGRIAEIKSPLILQPGPAALTEGLDAIAAALA